ncbi:GNAT family N-acetyltransferase [Paucibacter sp. B2R-40]|uniref:GNAT family N-acetyltransferase n=1 Tax=Paucibacter sp. B2R-40 TaxID=2893554 RepID=UPI0021E4D483|nr:GNAT family N-acetyltransferase [Paucibacter sp. B2R-40]MCV2355259.1 GNAT family N-acetyltransferase [Paucibacter sp. B2R-40]
MKDSIRPTRIDEISRLFEIRATTRENAIGRARLAELGITPDSIRSALQAGEMHSWVALPGEHAVAFCSVADRSGEVLVLAVQAGFEGRGLGRALLQTAVKHLREVAGCERIWLMAGVDPTLRSHGFYRAQGWRPSGRRDESGDEELNLA